MNWLDLAGALESEKDKSEPLYLQIVKFISGRIESGELAAGDRLPTNRELAHQLKVDRSTISRAYAELSELGVIESHVGRGTFVRSATPRTPRPKTNAGGGIAWNERFSQGSRTVSDIMDKQPPVAHAPELISFGGGLPTEEFYPFDELKRMLGDVLQSPKSSGLFEYSPAEGVATLRTEVLKHLSAQGIQAEDDELLIVSGSQQAIDLVTTVFVDPGDTVLLEDPSYFWAICNLRSHQARCVPVRVDDDGIDLEQLERELSRNRAKLIYTMPSYQNPTGAAMSLEKRHRLLELSKKYGVPILEDNFVGDLSYDGPALPPLRALPGGRDLVIHQGTFSKALCPGLRLGWLVAPAEVIARLLLAKRVSDLSTNSMAQLTLAHYLSAGLYSQHLQRVCAAYKKRRDVMLSAFNKYFRRSEPGWAVSWNKPHGGLFVWMKLPSSFSARELKRFAEAEGVTFSPGDLFFLSGDRHEFLRLCFIQTNEQQINEGMKRLSVAYEKYLESLRLMDRSRSLKQESMSRRRDQVLI